MTNIKNDTIDLQIFLTRIHDEEENIFHGESGIHLLSVRQSSEGLIRSSSFGDSKSTADGTQKVKYILIANSEYLETSEFPFSFDQVFSFVRALGTNNVRLKDCISFGSALFNFLFRGTIRDIYRQLRSDKSPMRLTIATNDPKMSIIPWELLCDVRAGALPIFLSCEQDLFFCRSLKLHNRQKFEEIPFTYKGDLRVALITASPTTLGYLNLDAEEKQLKFVLDAPPELQKIKFRSLHNATINSLRDFLDNFRPNILHFSGHGTFDNEEEQGYVILHSPDNHKKYDSVSAFRFASLIQECDDIQLVLLSSCFGAFAGTETALSGVAQCIHASGVNDVISLQFPLSDKTGHAIVLNFYKYLLRNSLTVEKCVGKVRRYLLINGYMTPECFGLTLYQGNNSQYWPQSVPITRKSITEARDFTEIVDLFESEGKKELEKRLSDEIQKYKEILTSIKEISNESLLLSIKVFDRIELALNMLKYVVLNGVDIDTFLSLARLASLLCHTPHENKLFPTAFILKMTENLKEDEKKLMAALSEKLPGDFYHQSLWQLIPVAIKVNGQDRAFLTVKEVNSKEVFSCVASLKSLDFTKNIESDFLGDEKWLNVYSSVKNDGCAFILPGDSRVKLLIKGDQLAEYREGKWLMSDFSIFKSKAIEVANSVGIQKEIMMDILRKSVMASELRRGITFMIEGSNKLLEKCHDGYVDVQSDERFVELKKKKIIDFGANEYLDSIYGDNAVILSTAGKIIAINASLAPSSTTDVEIIIGTGSRHISAQKITKETDALGLVVSEDGPITIFKDGIVIVRLLAEN